MTLRRFFRLAALGALVLSLAGCFVPERYIAKITLHRDGTYSIYAIGTAVDADAARAFADLSSEGAHLAPEALRQKRAAIEGRLEERLRDIRRDARIQAVRSIGGGRVRFSVNGTWRMDRSVLVFSELRQPITYAVGRDGTLRLRVRGAVPLRDMTALGVRTDGALSVVAGPGVSVLANNAKIPARSPNSSYRWFIGGPNAAVPYLKIRLPGSVPAKNSSAMKKSLVEHGEKR